MNKKVGLISENNGSTVVSLYDGLNRKETNYQTEEQLEKEFIKTLVEQGYEYLTIDSEQALVNNLRDKLEKLNNFKFSNTEWNNFFINYIANKNDSIVDKTRTIQKDYIKNITLDDGFSTKNIRLIDKDNIHNNYLQVINQYENTGARDNRYDVTILVNGLPLVHIELKRRGVPLRKAFDQIDRYQRDSFWAGSGLYEYVQIFVISNGTYTKYYSNTTRDLHIRNKNIKTSNTFEFTSYWADQQNNTIIDLIDFAKTFCTKHSILNVLTKYCVFTSNEELMVMRPYQIVATEKILNKIQIAYNYKKYGSVDAGGYIWHTTGSGKTLTSFKTAQLATNLDFIDKVLFIVDRKDLDYQTMKEYDSFEKGAANSNTSTEVLRKQLDDPNTRIIITTIQKLSTFVKKYQTHDIFNKHIVFIFDECHRSQFGEMHKIIVNKFSKYYIFGFTGTPIFPSNARSIKGITQTTDQTFGERLHTYTIVNAINDKNVLPFKYDYVGRVDVRDDVEDTKVYSIDQASAFDNEMRIELITNYILDNFSKKTKTDNFLFKSIANIDELVKDNRKKEVKVAKSLDGFNSIFAVSSIEMAKKYYESFKRNPNNNLQIALIYSYGVNDPIDDGLLDENNESTLNLSQSDRDYLDYAIKDYNKMFGTSYDTSSDSFQNYYKDVSLRMKNKEIDILIVANMFLTGFDAKTLNTLWVDKNLKYHGLIQAFSRTNRILNSVKVAGNIVSFRNLETQLNDALALFGDPNSSGIVLMKPYKDYYYGYKDDKKDFPGYKALVEELLSKFPVGELIAGETNKVEFIKLYGSILRVTNILSSFDEFEGNEILDPRDIQDYHSMYQDIYDEFERIRKVEKENIAEDLVFEMELIKTININIDYILELVKKYHDSNMQDKELLVTINKAIQASPDLRNKKDLIQEFIDSLNQDSDVYSDFETFMNSKKKEELDKIIEEENLNNNETYTFVKKAFEQGRVEMNGTEISAILPQMSRFTKSNDRAVKKQKVLERIVDFFDKFFNISNNKF